MAEERVQRRLAAILAADVVGYSRLMSEDEEGTLARLKALRNDVIDPKISEYGGRIFKTTGDGILAEFPSAVDAVRHAIDVQRAMAEVNAKIPEQSRIVFRIGISLGDVMVDGDDLFGNGVNVAARMETLADPGGICISGNVQEHIGKTLGIAMEDLGEQTVKNIDRPVRCYRVQSGPIAQQPDSALTLLDKASIAVLPFANMSGDPEQEYFSDGISEDIITALSRARWFRVVSRNSTFVYKGTSLDVRQVAKDLDVRYVLEGSVRKAGNRVRITAQLIDGATDNHLWSERYDRELEDIFEVQDEITTSIAAQIEPELRKAEFNRAVISRPDSLNVWDLYQRGMWQIHRKENPDFRKALEHFQHAARLDPNFGPAQSGIALSCFWLLGFGQVDDRKTYDDLGVQAAKRAVELDGDDPLARWAMGAMHWARHDYAESAAELEIAIRLDPLNGRVRNLIGRSLVDMGKFSEAIEKMKETLDLCPNEPFNGIAMARMAEAYFHLGEYEQAITWSRKATREAIAPRMWGRATLLAALGHAGDTEGAKLAVEEMLDRRPDFSLTFARENYPLNIADAVEHFLDGLRKAGVPD